MKNLDIKNVRFHGGITPSVSLVRELKKMGVKPNDHVVVCLDDRNRIIIEMVDESKFIFDYLEKEKEKPSDVKP